jgi:DNA repair protein RecN (Recombination protein N)
LLLQKQDSQLSVVDILAKDQELLAGYQAAFARYQELSRRLEMLRQEIAQGQQNADFLQFQYNELSAARLQDGEQEELEQRSDTMTHSEDIKTALYEAQTAFFREENGILSSLKHAASSLHGIVHVLPKAAELADRIDSSLIELKDVAAEVDSQLDDIDFDPAELDAVNARLDKIYDLQKKYRVETVAELLAIEAGLKEKLSHIENSDEALADLEAERQEAEKICRQKADQLTALRSKAARQIEKEMLSRLVPLGMPHVRFAVTIEKDRLSQSGQDRVAFLFSANTSTPMQPVAQVASGGEIARVMLSLKAMISGAVKLPTIIFDEIDTGVSGKIAEKMAEIMQEMGLHERQVISITHLPQIAALGTHHYKVSKKETPQGTTSHMTELTADERITEIAQMLSGSDVSEAAIQNAKQLLRFAK